MRLTFLGTGAGTEPLPGLLHSAFAIENNGSIYWFDAGEGCSRTAHLLGLDLTSVRAVFISHTHMDHIGGLANLLWTIRKVHNVRHISHRKEPTDRLDVFMPTWRGWHIVSALLRQTEQRFQCDFIVDGHALRDRLVFADIGLRVRAHHNLHLPRDPLRGWLSYSFRVDVEGTSILYSGDVAHVSDVAPLLGNGVDLLLVETGHHSVDEICAWVAEQPTRIGKVGFTHHGRAIVADRHRQLEAAASLLGDNVFFAEEGMSIDL